MLIYLLASAKRQARHLYGLLLKTWAFYALCFVFILWLAMHVFGLRPGTLLHDPASVLKGAWYAGALSNIGILLWTITATLCLFSYSALRKYAPHSHLKSFLLYFGSGTVFLLLDDLYMWHEQLFPNYLGIHEHWVYAGYIFFYLFGVLRFAKTILRTDFIILGAAFLFTGLSLAVDIVDKPLAAFFAAYPTLEVLLEDSFKSIGIFTWCFYFTRLCFVEVLPALGVVRSPARAPQKQRVHATIYLDEVPVPTNASNQHF